MAKKAPMLGILFATEGKAAGANVKSKVKSVNTPAVPAVDTYKPPTDAQQIKNEAKYQKRRATEDWIAGRMTTAEHKAVHERAKHIMCGKDPGDFKGPSGEKKGKY